MRREYDFEYGNTDEFTQLVNSINAHKTAYGGSDMYIELARKFDNSDYQWVCYRNNLNSSDSGSTATTGYFVLFDKAGNVIKDVAFSYPFLTHGITQCVTSGSDPSTYINYKHIFLFFCQGSQVRFNYVNVYKVSAQIYSTGSITYSDLELTETKKNVYNFVTNNAYATTNGSNKLFFYGDSNRIYHCAWGVTITLDSVTSLNPSVSYTGDRKETDGDSIGCQQIYNNGSNFYYATWHVGSDAASTMGWTVASSYTQWTRNKTTLAPYVNTYSDCFMLPIWSYNITQKSYNNEMVQKSLWWQTTDSYLERKYMLSDYKTGAVVSQTGSEQAYRIPISNTLYKPHALGLISADGNIIYTFNINSKVIERIITKA